MSIYQDEVTATDLEISQLDKIFSVPPQKVSLDILHDFSSRLFSESMSKINKLTNDKTTDPADVNSQIKLIQQVYNQYFLRIQSNLFKSCKDQPSVIGLLNIAKDCQARGDDFVGYAIYLTLTKFFHETQIKMPALGNSALYKNIYENYFPIFSSTGSYKAHLETLKTKMISPALPFYFAIYTDSTDIDKKYKPVKDIKDALTNVEWKKITDSLSGKQKSEYFDQIQGILQHLGKANYLEAIDQIFMDFDISSYDSLAKLFTRVDSHFEQKGIVKTDDFLNKYTASINPLLIRNKPETTAQHTPAEIEERQPQAPIRQAKSNMARPVPAKINSHDLLRKAKAEKEQFQLNHQNQALSDGDIVEGIRLNNNILHILKMQTIASEERCYPVKHNLDQQHEIPSEEYTLQSALNAEIEALKTENASLRKKQFKPDEEIIERPQFTRKQAEKVNSGQGWGALWRSAAEESVRQPEIEPAKQSAAPSTYSAPQEESASTEEADISSERLSTPPASKIIIDHGGKTVFYRRDANKAAFNTITPEQATELSNIAALVNKHKK